MVFMLSIACEIITIGSGITTPKKARKYTKGLTQLFGFFCLFKRLSSMNGLCGL